MWTSQGKRYIPLSVSKVPKCGLIETPGNNSGGVGDSV